MSFPDITLDDRSFQDLVNEARRRVSERCPEWTEHNVSDPGITLIETFAWMTEMLVYRVNRLPDKLHLALLRLLGVEREPPSAAIADLRFQLAAPAAAPVRIPGGDTEVTTAGGHDDDTIVFRVCWDFVVEPVRLQAYALQRSGAIDRVAVADGRARPSGADEPAFSLPPAIGDAVYLGFDRPLDRLVLRVEVEGSRARGVGIDPAAAPLCWEASRGSDWDAVEVLRDTTGGFNEAGGAIELQLPLQTSPATFAGAHMYWLRCRVTELTPAGRPSPRYSHPPRIRSITAAAVGALVRAEHAATEQDELLGESDGTSGQTFAVRHRPALELRDGEGLEVLEPDGDGWIPWEQRDSFDASDADDRHYRFDAASGEIELGPAVRTRDGWRQHGRIPPKGARLRMSRYRHGGGERGAVAGGALRQLRTPVPGVASVSNPAAAQGGVDVESLATARRRAALELRTRYRAVTPEDFEFLAAEAPVKVGRARCLEPAPGMAIPVYVLPTVVDPGRQLSHEELTPGDDLLRTVAAYLDERRLMGTSVHVMPVPLRGITAVVDARIARAAAPESVEDEIEAALYRFLNPLVGGEGEGWEFGRPLNEGQLYALVQDVPGVERVRMVRMYETDIRTPTSPSQEPAGAQIALAPNELLCSATHRVRATRHDR